MSSFNTEKVFEIVRSNPIIPTADADQLGDMVRVATLVPGPATREQAQAICRYFGSSDKFPVEHAKEYFWELVREIRQHVFLEMQLWTGEEWRVDWSREDGAFCLWYRHRDQRRDATRDLAFVRNTTLRNLDGVIIGESGEHGYGVFATRAIEEGEQLARLDGQALSVDEYDRLHVTMGHYLGRLRAYFFMEWNATSEDMVLARPYRTMYSYINHSNTPNLILVPETNCIFVKCLRRIESGEECFLDYRKESLPKGYFDDRANSYLRERPLWGE